MNTIKDALLKIYEWYFDYKNTYDCKLNEDEYYNDEAMMYIHDCVLSLSDKEFDKIMSLLILEYYNILLYEQKYYDAFPEEKTNIDDEEFEISEQILEYIKDYNKEELLDSIRHGNSEYLIDILDLILSDYKFEENDIYVIEDYNYDYLNYNLKNEEILNIYKEFHPNLYEEKNNIVNYYKEEELQTNINNYKVKSVFEYIYCFLIAKQLLKNNQIKYLFNIKLLQIKEQNYELYESICCYILSYMYVVLSNKENIDKSELFILKRIRNKDKNLFNTINFYDDIFKCFIDWDIIKHETMLNKSSDEVKKMVKKLNNYTKKDS